MKKEIIKNEGKMPSPLSFSHLFNRYLIGKIYKKSNVDTDERFIIAYDYSDVIVVLYINDVDDIVVIYNISTYYSEYFAHTTFIETNKHEQVVLSND